MYKRLYLNASVTAPFTFMGGELIGLTVTVTDSHRPLIDHAVFRPERMPEALDPELAPGISLEDARNRLPFSFYRQAVERILNQADSVSGPHVERDLGFLRAQGVDVAFRVVDGTYAAGRMDRACLTV